MYGQSNRRRWSMVCIAATALAISGVGSLMVLPGTLIARPIHRPLARHRRASTRVPAPYSGHRAPGHKRVGGPRRGEFPR